jgi:hypothetical protein
MISELWELRQKDDYLGMLNHALFENELTNRGVWHQRTFTKLSFDDDLVGKIGKYLVKPSLELQQQQDLLDSNFSQHLIEFRAKLAIMAGLEHKCQEHLTGLNLLGPLYTNYFLIAANRAHSALDSYLAQKSSKEKIDVYQTVLNSLQNSP